MYVLLGCFVIEYFVVMKLCCYLIHEILQLIFQYYLIYTVDQENVSIKNISYGHLIIKLNTQNIIILTVWSLLCEVNTSWILIPQYFINTYLYNVVTLTIGNIVKVHWTQTNKTIGSVTQGTNHSNYSSQNTLIKRTAVTKWCGKQTILRMNSKEPEYLSTS